MEIAFPGNIWLFHLINASTAPNPASVLIATALAQYTPWLTIVVLVIYWFLGPSEKRRTLMISGVALAIGLATNFAITSTIYTPRPFELGIGSTLLSHGRETSFPSDHATFLWSLGVSLLMSRTLPRLGAFIFTLGLATAWARIYLGVHFPLDMAASLAISLLAATVALVVSKKLDRILFQPVERINAILLQYLRIRTR